MDFELNGLIDEYDI